MRDEIMTRSAVRTYLNCSGTCPDTDYNYSHTLTLINESDTLLHYSIKKYLYYSIGIIEKFSFDLSLLNKKKGINRISNAE